MVKKLNPSHWLGDSQQYLSRQQQIATMITVSEDCMYTVRTSISVQYSWPQREQLQHIHNRESSELLTL